MGICYVVLKIESRVSGWIVHTVFLGIFSRKYGRHYHDACGDMSIRLEQAKRANCIAQGGFLGIPHKFDWRALFNWIIMMSPQKIRLRAEVYTLIYIFLSALDFSSHPKICKFPWTPIFSFSLSMKMTARSTGRHRFNLFAKEIRGISEPYAALHEAHANLFASAIPCHTHINAAFKYSWWKKRNVWCFCHLNSKPIIILLEGQETIYTLVYQEAAGVKQLKGNRFPHKNKQLLLAISHNSRLAAKIKWAQC